LQIEQKQSLTATMSAPQQHEQCQ